MPALTQSDIRRLLALLNDRVKGFMSAHGDFAPFLELDHLRVMIAQPTYMLAIKCLAMRIGAEFHDEAIKLAYSREIRLPRIMAERVGFEPTVPVKERRFSRPVHSTALPPLLVSGAYGLPAILPDKDVSRLCSYSPPLHGILYELYLSYPHAIRANVAAWKMPSSKPRHSLTSTTRISMAPIAANVSTEHDSRS
jgi:hypothetical protein